MANTNERKNNANKWNLSIAESDSRNRIKKHCESNEYNDKYDNKYDNKYDAEHNNKHNNKYDNKYDSKHNNKYDVKHNNKYDNKYDVKHNDKHNDKYDNKYNNEYKYKNTQTSFPINRLDFQSYKNNRENTFLLITINMINIFSVVYV